MYITLSNHGKDELVQLKDEQSDWCWVDVPTQAAPDLRPTRTLERCNWSHSWLTSPFTSSIAETVVSLEAMNLSRTQAHFLVITMFTIPAY